MTGRSSHSHASLNPGGGQNEVSTIDEQYGIHFSIHMDKHQIEGGDFEDPQAYSQRHLQYGYNQWNNQLQSSNQQPRLYSTACQSDRNHHDNPQYNGQTEERCPPQYHEQVFQGRGTNPALPTTAAPPYDDTFHSFGYDDQILATGEQFNQSAGPPESANELQGRWNAAQHNTGHDVDAGPDVDQLYDMRIDARVDLVDSPGRSTTNGRRYEPAADEQAGIPISTVLGRIIGWHAKLAHAFGQVRTDHRPNGVSSALASPIDPALSHDHTATVPAQVCNVFPATQQRPNLQTEYVKPLA
ncbi:hypothetical protein EKO04_005828 [Ascochyta lentis]|uniref:Uncharacterized protein n=1 Tax=Ascochyta lentis TaxID=205686 RepID=A0A8H7MIL6_9PLEO|nr:hypothetical protein EKO04_005828 [Ascochyta lentis]